VDDVLQTVETQYFVDGARGIACDPAGNIFVASETKNCIYQIENGMLFASTFAGHQGGFAGNVDGLRLQSQFNGPYATLYVNCPNSS
jgi:hypothetical protein